MPAASAPLLEPDPAQHRVGDARAAVGAESPQAR